MEESMARFNGTYAVDLGNRRLIATQEPGFIDYILKTNHRNYHKSTMVTDQLGKFLGKGLLTSNGDYWLKQRRLIQPGFHHDKIRALYAIIKKTVDKFIVDFPTGEVDVYPLMNRLAFEIVVNTLFDVHIAPETRNELSRFITDTQNFVIKDLRQPHKSWWFSLSGEVSKNLRSAGRARGIIRTIIRTRQAENARHDDLLDMLLNARYEDTGAPMDEEQVIDEILVLLIAGHETSANSLSWTLYLLAHHQEELDRLRATTRDLGLDACVADDHLKAVLNESMRLYPPAWVTDRVALEDDGYRDFTFRAGTIIILFYYGLHRDAHYWDNPTSFVPGRFSKTAIDKEKPKAFYPFGAGPRLCIGNNFAMAEMAIFLQAMIQHFDLAPGISLPGLRALLTLRPDRVMLTVNRRGANREQEQFQVHSHVEK